MDAKMRADFVNSVASGQKVPCPVCNTLNDPDGSFCIACGHSLKKEEKKDEVEKYLEGVDKQYEKNEEMRMQGEKGTVIGKKA